MSNDPRVTKGRQTGRAKTPPPAPVERIVVHPVVWETAMRLAGGQRRLIEVLGPTAVKVSSKS